MAAANDGKTFNADVTAWAKQFNVDMLALARQSIFTLSEKVVLDTPLDVGFLRGSWQPSFNTPSTEANDGTGNAMATISAEIKGLKLGDVFWMTNNAAYALRLEYGFVGPDSLGRVYDQKGRFYVTTNMAKWSQIVEDTAKELGAL